LDVKIIILIYLIWYTLEEIEHPEWVEYLLSLAQVRKHVFVPLRGSLEKVVELSALHTLFLLVPRRGILLMEDLQ
jgi:hypothetical protein